jgi:hypothetical protein
MRGQAFHLHDAPLDLALRNARPAGRAAQLIQRVGIERDAVRQALGPGAALDLPGSSTSPPGTAGGEAVT